MADNQQRDDEVIRAHLQALADTAPPNPHSTVDIVRSAGAQRKSARRHPSGSALVVTVAASVVLIAAATFGLGAMSGSNVDTKAQPASSASATNHDERPTATTSPAGTGRPARTPSKIATSDFPRNSHGQTYGSDAYVASPTESGPDLVAVRADNGAVGFAKREELYVPAARGEASSESQQLDVYDFEGEVIVGTMTLHATFDLATQ
jgi:hypothetical protein